MASNFCSRDAKDYLIERDACPRGIVFGILEDLVHGECAAGFGSDIINGRKRVMLVADYS